MLPSKRGPYKEYYDIDKEFVKPRTTILSQHALTRQQSTDEDIVSDDEFDIEGENVLQPPSAQTSDIENNEDSNLSSITAVEGGNPPGSFHDAPLPLRRSSISSSDVTLPGENSAAVSPSSCSSNEEEICEEGVDYNLYIEREPSPDFLDHDDHVPDQPDNTSEAGLQVPLIPQEIETEPTLPAEEYGVENRELNNADQWNKKHEWDKVFPLQLKRSRFEIMLEIFHVVMRHGSFSGPLIKDLLMFVNSLFDQNVVPESEYLFHKLFAHSQHINFHFFCGDCELYFGVLCGPVSCRNCHSVCEISGMNRGSFFISLSIRQQLEQVLQNPNVKIVPHLNRSPRLIQDIMDGSLYRKLCEPGEILSNENALSATFSADGAPAFRSNAGSIWPLQLYVNEISREQRFAYENVVLCGLWFGKKDPCMNFFLLPFIEEMNQLAREGITRKTSDGVTVVSPVHALTCSVDSVAKPKLQNIKQFNGRFGCGYCFHPNEVVECSDEEEIDDPDSVTDAGASNQNQQCGNSTSRSEAQRPQKKKGRKERRYISRVTYPLRSHEETKSDMLRADELDSQGLLKPPDDHVHGLKGISALLLLLNFNIVYGFVIDYMHNVLAGVAQRLTELICKNLSEEKIRELNKILVDFTPPQNILRRPRPLSERADFKCKEWRACLLFYYLPIFKDEIPQDVFDLLSSFVIAINSLLKKSITRDELQVATELLDFFVKDFNRIYGDINMVYNVHLISHLADIVEMWGPLWAYSAFTFESGIGELLKLIAGSSFVPTQICQKYSLIKSVNFFMAGRQVSNATLDFCSKILCYKYTKNISIVGNAKALGTSTALDLSHEDRAALVSAGFEDYANSVENMECFRRVCLSQADGNPFYSAVNKRQTVYNDTCVQLSDKSYGITEKFVLFCDDGESASLWVFFRPITLSEQEPLAPHIKTCAFFYQAEPLRFIPSSIIKCKALLLSCKGKTYVMDFPNFFEKY